MNESTRLLPNEDTIPRNETRNKPQKNCLSSYPKTSAVLVLAVFGILSVFLFRWIIQDTNSINALMNQSTPPFMKVVHPIVPQLISPNLKAPFPTNEWWTNLLIRDSQGKHPGEGPITASPYTFKSTPLGLQVSYGATRRTVNATMINEVFHPDLLFEMKNSQGQLSRQVENYDPLSVTVKFYNNQSTEFLAYLVRGSPYVTVEYKKAFPILLFGEQIISFQNKMENATKKNSIVSAHHCTITTSTNQTWKLYTNDSSLQFTWDGKTQLKSTSLFTGVLRAAFISSNLYPEPRLNNSPHALYSNTNNKPITSIYGDNNTNNYDKSEAKLDISHTPSTSIFVDTNNNKKNHNTNTNDETILDQHALTYPIGGDVIVNASGNTGTVQFQWITKGGNPMDLLMLAHPHQVDSFNQTEHPRSSMYTHLGFNTVKGKMTGIKGSKWEMVETLTSIQFDAPRKIQNESYVNEILKSLKPDAKVFPTSKDPYFFGKQIARQARLALLANEFQQLKLRDSILDNLVSWITPWLNDKNSDKLVYDTVWGGTCSKNGVDGIFWMTDFGNGWYNDHHFHYGYFLYTAAVIGRFRPMFVQDHQISLLSLVRDIANPSKSDTYFPFTRHFSWFDGHSWASGVFNLEEGKSQESISEAIHAYYSVYLLGSVMQLENLRQFGRVLLALEMRAAHTYWQMPSWNKIYPKVYASNKMTGQIASTRVMYETCFGNLSEYMHLINMIPFTPITEELISLDYVKEQYPVLHQQEQTRPSPHIVDGWKGYALMNYAVINPEDAWQQLEKLHQYDDGNSRSNALYWIATRGNTMEQKRKTKSI